MLHTAKESLKEKSLAKWNIVTGLIVLTDICYGRPGVS